MRAVPSGARVWIVAGVTDTGCGSKLDDTAKTLGEDVMEELEYVPGRIVVNRIISPRLSCKSCETISQAPMPSRPIWSMAFWSCTITLPSAPCAPLPLAERTISSWVQRRAASPPPSATHSSRPASSTASTRKAW